jgi:signal transduction histidine kinase
MLDHAEAVARRDEGTGEEKFVVETFKKSIEMLSLQKEQLTRLHEAERTRAEELEQTAAGIAHEFRNSLATILGYLKLAQRNELPFSAMDRIRAADREAQLLTQAVERLLRFARPLEPDRQETCLLDLSHEIADRFRESADGITIKVKGEKTSACVDVALVRIALENVLRNAIESIQRSPGVERRIEIEVAGNPQPTVIVRDTGVGLDAADAPRLFLPFHSQRPGGVGLGLAMTRKIVQRHGGRITLAGQPGQGAEVNIELPRGTDNV